jgi:hypothetical protein
MAMSGQEIYDNFHKHATDDLGSVVHIENRVSGQFLHQRSDVTAYQHTADMVRDAALSTEDSIRLIANLARRMEQA